jgi:hypothetical protein
MQISSSKMTNWIGNLGGSDLAGLFLTLRKKSSDNYIDVVQLEINGFESTNNYMYGFGNEIFRYGPGKIENSKIYQFGKVKPKTDATSTNGAPITFELRPDHYVKFDNFTAEDTNGGTDGSAFYIKSDTSQTVTALGTNNVEIVSSHVLNCISANALIKLNANSLIVEVNDITMTGNSDTVDGAIYATSGGTITFNRATMTDNIGTLGR